MADATNDGGTETIKAAVIKAGARQRAFSNANRPAPIIESQVATDIFRRLLPSFPKQVSKKNFPPGKRRPLATGKKGNSGLRYFFRVIIQIINVGTAPNSQIINQNPSPIINPIVPNVLADWSLLVITGFACSLCATAKKPDTTPNPHNADHAKNPIKQINDTISPNDFCGFVTC